MGEFGSFALALGGAVWHAAMTAEVAIPLAEVLAFLDHVGGRVLGRAEPREGKVRERPTYTPIGRGGADWRELIKR